MDGAAPCAKPGRDSPLIPPNFVSLRHLQELRLKEQEVQRRRREEEAAAGRAKKEKEEKDKAAAAPARHLETKVSSDASGGAKERPFRGQHEWQRRRRGEEAAVGRVKAAAAAAAQARGPEAKDSSGASCDVRERSFRGHQERRRRPEEDADVGRVKEKEAVEAPGPETKAWSNTSRGIDGRPFGGLRGQQQWVAVAHRAPPPLPSVEGTFKKKDGAIEDRRDMKGSAVAACNPSQRGGHKAENNGKKISTATKGEVGEPAKMIIASSHGSKPEKKMEGKGNPLGDQSTAPGANDGPGEAAGALPRYHVWLGNKHKRKKGSDDRRNKTNTTSTLAETTDASWLHGVKLDNKGNEKLSLVRRLDIALGGDSPGRKKDQSPLAAEGSSNQRSGDSPDRKRGQPPLSSTNGSSNQRSGSGHDVMTGEAKSESLGGKQPVVEMKGTAGDGRRNNQRSGSGHDVMTVEAKSENLGGKQPVVEMKGKVDWNSPVGPPLSSTDSRSSNQRRGSCHGAMTGVVKSESLGRKKPVVEKDRADWNLPTGPLLSSVHVRSNNQRRGSGHGVTIREAKSEGLGGKQPVVEVNGAADRNSLVLRTALATGEAKPEGLVGKHSVVELKHMVRRKPQAMSSSSWRLPGGRHGNASMRQHSGVWVPKAAATSPSFSGVVGL